MSPRIDVAEGSKRKSPVASVRHGYGPRSAIGRLDAALVDLLNTADQAAVDRIALKCSTGVVERKKRAILERVRRMLLAERKGAA